jgi:ribosomal protein L34
MSGDSRNNLFEGKDASYRVGDEILRGRIPFAYVVNQKLAETTCDECLKRTDQKSNSKQKFFLRCSGCKYVRYCSTTCQKVAWTGSSSGFKSGHREECAYLQRVKPRIPPDTVRLLARIILRLRCGGTLDIAEIPNGNRRCFIDLMANEKSLVRESPQRVEAFNTYLKVLEECFPSNACSTNKHVSPIKHKVRKRKKKHGFRSRMSNKKRQKVYYNREKSIRSRLTKTPKQNLELCVLQAPDKAAKPIRYTPLEAT